MLRRMCTVLLALAAISVLAVSTAAPAGAAVARVRLLTAMSFNIHHGQGTDGVLELRRIAGVIRAGHADVVGLQEVDRHYSERSHWADQATELAGLLGWHLAFGANIDQDPPAAGRPRIQYGTAILSRYPITRAENTYLARSPQEEQRGLLHAQVDVRGVPVHVYDTHLAAASGADRIAQARQIVGLIGDREPSMLLGDLNATPEAAEITTLAGRFTDAWVASGTGPEVTYPAEAPVKRIDYLFTSRHIRPLWTRVVLADPVASDHLPVASLLLVR